MSRNLTRLTVDFRS